MPDFTSDVVNGLRRIVDRSVPIREYELAVGKAQADYDQLLLDDQHLMSICEELGIDIVDALPSYDGLIRRYTEALDTARLRYNAARLLYRLEDDIEMTGVLNQMSPED